MSNYTIETDKKSQKKVMSEIIRDVKKKTKKKCDQLIRLDGSPITKTKISEKYAYQDDSQEQDHNKTTEKTYHVTNFYIAVAMIKSFHYRRWMSYPEVTGPNGERIDYNGDVFIPVKRVRKRKGKGSD